MILHRTSGRWYVVPVEGNLTVNLDGVAVTGAPLDFLVNEFFLHLFPDAKVNQPFELHDNIERIELRPDGVRVTIKK